MTSDVPHVSFLGFEAVLSDLDVESVRMWPDEQSSWVTVDRAGRTRARRSVTVNADETARSIIVEVDSSGRLDDRMVNRADLSTNQEAPFSLRKWSLESSVLDRYGQLRPRTRMVEGGRVHRGRIRWDGVARTEPELGDRPVCVPWTWFLLAEHDAGLEVAPPRVLDVLDGLCSFSPAVRWQGCGKVIWKEHELRGFRVFGPSLSVRHLWVGPSGAVLFELGVDRAIVRQPLWEGRA